MQILTLNSWSNAFDFEKLLHIRETQLMIRTASCAVSHWGLAGSTALTQTCAARDKGFLPHFYCLTATMLPQTAISNQIIIPQKTQLVPRVCYLTNTGQSNRWLQSERFSEISRGISQVFVLRWVAVRREVSLWRLLTFWSWASCFNRAGSPVLALTARNAPSGLWNSSKKKTKLLHVHHSGQYFLK